MTSRMYLIFDHRSFHCRHVNCSPVVRVFLIVVIVVFTRLSIASAPSALTDLLLDGTSGSYVRLSDWTSCSPASTDTSWTLSFEFRTSRSDCLLMYADSGLLGNQSDTKNSTTTYQWFVEIRLIQGLLHVRADRKLSLTSSASILNNNQSHYVAITSVIGVSRRFLQITVDRQTFTATGGGLGLGSTGSRPPVAPAAGLFFGGLPHVNVSLRIPSAVFEPPFVGTIRRAAYCVTTTSAVMTSSNVVDVKVLSSSGLRSNMDDSCAIYNPCQHDATCLSTDQGPVCDCSTTGADYIGTFCDRGIFIFHLLIFITRVDKCTEDLNDKRTAD